jgi:hypothetical protein
MYVLVAVRFLLDYLACGLLLFPIQRRRRSALTTSGSLRFLGEDG